MKKIEKAMNLEAARVLMIEGRDLINKGFDKILEVTGRTPHNMDEWLRYENFISDRITEVVVNQEELGIK